MLVQALGNLVSFLKRPSSSLDSRCFGGETHCWTCAGMQKCKKWNFWHMESLSFHFGPYVNTKARQKRSWYCKPPIPHAVVHKELCYTMMLNTLSPAEKVIIASSSFHMPFWNFSEICKRKEHSFCISALSILKPHILLSASEDQNARIECPAAVFTA